MSALVQGECAERVIEEEYLSHRPRVLAGLAVRYPRLAPDARAELYQDAWVSVLRRRSEGVVIENLGAYLMGAADKLAAKRTFGADARRRISFDPQESSLLSLADHRASPEEQVLAGDEARRVRAMVDELTGVEGAVLKLRLELALEPAEIRKQLGLTHRQYRRAAERAGKALTEQFALFASDAFERRRRSLLCACVLGVATQRQREKAQRLLDEDPYARAILGELRQLGTQAAGLVPLPAAGAMAGSHGESAGPLAEIAASAKQQVVDVLASAKHNAVALSQRVGDPTPIAGARPGAVAAAVAGCIAASTGAYCAVEGVPDPIRPALGIAHTAPSEGPKKETAEKATEPAPQQPAPAPVVQVDPPKQPVVTPQQAPPAPAAPAAPAPEPAPPPPPAPEFEPRGSAAGGENSPRPSSQNSAAPPAQAPAPAATGPGAEFGP